jgi:hypothetical protein
MTKASTLDALGPRLAELGFKKRAGEVYTLPLSDEVLGWLGLNRATRHHQPGEVEINPVVGIRNQQVERLVAELQGEKFHGYSPPTASSPLGYLFPEPRYRSWIFAPDRGDGPAADLASAVATHAMPFIRSLTDLPALCRALDNRLGIEHQLAYRRPVAWLLAGDPARAIQALDESLGKLAQSQDLYAAELRRFAEEFRRRL